MVYAFKQIDENFNNEKKKKLPVDMLHSHTQYTRSIYSKYVFIF